MGQSGTDFGKKCVGRQGIAFLRDHRVASVRIENTVEPLRQGRLILQAELPSRGGESPLVAGLPAGKAENSHRLLVPSVEKAVAPLIEEEYTAIPVLPARARDLDSKCFADSLHEVIAMRVEYIFTGGADP